MLVAGTSRRGVTLPPVTAYRHLEISAALNTLADLLTKAQFRLTTQQGRDQSGKLGSSPQMADRTALAAADPTRGALTLGPLMEALSVDR
jgi:hypothetical protein